MFLFTIVAKPDSADPGYGNVGGAYVNAWIRSDHDQEAEASAKALITKSGWSPGRTTSVLQVQSPNEVAEEDRDFLAEAESLGYCLVFHQWPNDAADSNVEFESN